MRPKLRSVSVPSDEISEFNSTGLCERSCIQAPCAYILTPSLVQLKFNIDLCSTVPTFFLGYLSLANRLFPDFDTLEVFISILTYSSFRRMLQHGNVLTYDF
uniref:Uncharacterized protein n=1 Tax=Schistocephalus solidus TaxID=70667 RepID=A0A0X3NTL1_SCHSO